MGFTLTDKVLIDRAARLVNGQAKQLRLAHEQGGWATDDESRKAKLEYDRLLRDERDLRALGKRLATHFGVVPRGKGSTMVLAGKRLVVRPDDGDVSRLDGEIAKVLPPMPAGTIGADLVMPPGTPGEVVRDLKDIYGAPVGHEAGTQVLTDPSAWPVYPADDASAKAAPLPAVSHG